MGTINSPTTWVKAEDQVPFSWHNTSPSRRLTLRPILTTTDSSHPCRRLSFASSQRQTSLTVHIKTGSLIIHRFLLTALMKPDNSPANTLRHPVWSFSTSL